MQKNDPLQKPVLWPKTTRSVCGLNGFHLVFWPFFAFWSFFFTADIAGQKGGKTGFLVVLEARGGSWRRHFCTPRFSRGKHALIFRGGFFGLEKMCFWPLSGPHKTISTFLEIANFDFYAPGLLTAQFGAKIKLWRKFPLIWGVCGCLDGRARARGR